MNDQQECLYRILGYCPRCERDYNPDHHPNNYDCKRYQPVSMVTFTVVEPGELENKLMRK